jgi:hypothetical protein
MMLFAQGGRKMSLSELHDRLNEYNAKAKKLRAYINKAKEEKKHMEVKRKQQKVDNPIKCVHCAQFLWYSKCRLPCIYHFAHTIDQTKPDCIRGLECHKLHHPNNFVDLLVNVKVFFEVMIDGIQYVNYDTFKGKIVKDMFAESMEFWIQFENELPISGIACLAEYVIIAENTLVVHAKHIVSFIGKIYKSKQEIQQRRDYHYIDRLIGIDSFI